MALTSPTIGAAIIEAREAAHRRPPRRAPGTGASRTGLLTAAVILLTLAGMSAATAMPGSQPDTVINVTDRVPPVAMSFRGSK